MKYFFAIILLPLFVFLPSCTTYYYSMMSSNDPYLIKNEKGEFVIEGDSLDVIYRFRGKNAPVELSIYNKTAQPIFVDWHQSGIEIDNRQEAFDEFLDANTHQQHTTVVDYGRYLSQVAQLGYVAPYSSLDKQVLELTGFNFGKIPNSEFRKQASSIFRGKDSTKHRAINYGLNNSPVYLKTYLSIYNDARKRQEPLYYENEFYMSQLVKAGRLSPHKVPSVNEKQADVFYVSQDNAKTAKKVGITSLKVLGAVFYYSFKLIEILLSQQAE